MARGESQRPHPTFSPAFLARYQTQQVLGTGGSSVVYRGTQLGLMRPVAIKVLEANSFEAKEAERRFEEEAKIAARLDHPNIVRLYEFGRDGALMFLVYELVDGVDLGKRITMGGSGSRRGLPFEEAVQIMRDVARGLEYAHKLDVVHRDLKPANVLVGQDGGAKLADFGLARVLGAAREVKTATGMVVGTPECMAPEQARAGDVGPAADIYALGVLGWWMLAGRPPFEAENPVELLEMQVKAKPPKLAGVRPGLPPGLYELVDCLLAKRPGDRPNATDLLRALKVAERYEPGAVEQVQSALSASRIKLVGLPRGGGKALTPALALLAVLGLVGWALFPARRPTGLSVAASPTRARFLWSGGPASIMVRPKDGSRDWRRAEGRALTPEEAAAAGAGGPDHRAELAGLTPGETYAWRLEDDPPGSEAEFRTPEPAAVEGPWPRFGVDGVALGWLVRPPEDGAAVGRRDGARAELGADGLVEVPAVGFELVYPGGVAEEPVKVGTPPALAEAVEGLAAALEAMDVRRVVGAAVVRKAHERPSLVARRAALAEYARWKGLEAALPGRIRAMGPAERLRLVRALARADAVDRALRTEGHTPVFDVAPTMTACLPVVFLPDPSAAAEAEIDLATDEERRLVHDRRLAVPPQKPVPEGSGRLKVTLAVKDLGAHQLLELEVGSLRIPLRPPCTDYRFSGQVEVRIDPELVIAGSLVRLHLVREDLPGVTGPLDPPRYPLLGGPPPPAAPARPRFLGWELRRLDPRDP